MTPIPTPLSWTLATHGIHITFHSPTGTRHSGTYLPEVAPAQGWTKEETIRSLVRKAGYRGKVEEGDEVWNGMQVKVYESCKGKKSWGEFVEWKRGRGE
jgi:AMMECR1 domain-containing protein